MGGGYDLYGNYYPNINDAINAEMVQCNEIENRLNEKKIRELEMRMQEQQIPSNEEEIHNIWGMIEKLEKRIKTLEGLTFRY